MTNMEISWIKTAITRAATVIHLMETLIHNKKAMMMGLAQIFKMKQSRKKLKSKLKLLLLQLLNQKKLEMIMIHMMKTSFKEIKFG